MVAISLNILARLTKTLVLTRDDSIGALGKVHQGNQAWAARRRGGPTSTVPMIPESGEE
jgi:hypothetical protein